MFFPLDKLPEDGHVEFGNKAVGLSRLIDMAFVVPVSYFNPPAVSTVQDNIFTFRIQVLKWCIKIKAIFFCQAFHQL